MQQKSDKITVQLETAGGGTVTSVSLKATGDSGSGHNLIKLAENTGVISRDERQDVDARKHLAELASYVAWRGRYPVPKSIRKDDAEERLNNLKTIEFVRLFSGICG